MNEGALRLSCCASTWGRYAAHAASPTRHAEDRRTLPSRARNRPWVCPHWDDCSPLRRRSIAPANTVPRPAVPSRLGPTCRGCCYGTRRHSGPRPAEPKPDCDPGRLMCRRPDAWRAGATISHSAARSHLRHKDVKCDGRHSMSGRIARSWEPARARPAIRPEKTGSEEAS